MARSSKKIGRLVDLFHDLETAERMKVGELTRQMNEIRSSQGEILARLADPASIHDPFLGLMSKSVDNMERRAQRVAGQRETAIRRYADAASRTRGAASLQAELRAQEDRKSEKKELEALLEFQQAAAAQGRGKPTRST